MAETHAHTRVPPRMHTHTHTCACWPAPIATPYIHPHACTGPRRVFEKFGAILSSRGGVLYMIKTLIIQARWGACLCRDNMEPSHPQIENFLLKNSKMSGRLDPIFSIDPRTCIGAGFDVRKRKEIIYGSARGSTSASSLSFR